MPQSGDWEHPKRWVRPEEITHPHPMLAPEADYVQADLSQVNPEYAADIDRQLPGFDWRSLAKEAFGIGIPGYTTSIESAYVSTVRDEAKDIVFKINVDFEGAEPGYSIGYIRRIIRQDTVYHDSFFLDAKHQDKGIAADMLDRMETAYMKHGIKKITLMANDSIGGYAWARQGFDFNFALDRNTKINVDHDALETIENYITNNNLGKDEFENLVDSYYELEHAWDIAAWNPTNASPGQHLGKAILIGTAYSAAKDLNLDSAGYKIGKKYREARNAARREHGKP